MDTAPEMPWWQRIGTLIDSYELPLINPYDPGYPAWPQADRSVRLLGSGHGTRLVITDGLGGADLPEYYVETSEPVEQLSGHWATNLIIEIGRLVPTNPDGIAAMLDQHGLLSLELEIDGAPADWSTTNPVEPNPAEPEPAGSTMVGLLLGLPHPYQTARQLVNVKLIRPAELRDCLDQGAAGRAELQQRFLDQGNPTISDLDRPSVT